MADEKENILRVVDANFNRCKEGLRVAEDIFRFILADDKLRKKIRRLRHGLDDIAKNRIIKQAVLSRNSQRDLGRAVDVWESKRRDTLEVLYINLQRAKESLRVMEEFFKIISRPHVKDIKKLRYELYSVEKEIVRRGSALCNFRCAGN